jgi:competence/damage-inducible protein CinA-like protein
MPTVEIIAIGTELLLGEIQDTNTQYLARKLRDAGVDLYRTTIVGDNVDRIAVAIREAMQRSQIIITTGGLGPTVDDPTRNAVAKALGVETEFVPELWEQIQARFERYGRKATENNRRQAYIPHGANPVENPVGTAPAFIVERDQNSIISLPGVPREMEYLLQNTIMPYLRERYHLKGTIKALVIHVAGVGESQVDEWIGDLETLQNPTVGLLAHPGVTDIRITAKADSPDEAENMISGVAKDVFSRVGEAAYGTDEDTLESVLLKSLTARHQKLVVFESGMNDELVKRASHLVFSTDALESSDLSLSVEQLRGRLSALKSQQNADVALGVIYTPAAQQQKLLMVVQTSSGEVSAQKLYGGPAALGIPWGVNTSLDFLRRNLNAQK